MVSICGRFAFVGFKIVLHFQVVLRYFVQKSDLVLWRGLYLWKNRFTFVGILRWWAGLRLTALHT